MSRENIFAKNLSANGNIFINLTREDSDDRFEEVWVRAGGLVANGCAFERLLE